MTGPERPGSLTRDEVEALEPGTIIEVIWSGGNGPHRYRVHVENGQRYAASIEGRGSPMHNPLEFVGQEPHHTRVWFVSPERPTTEAGRQMLENLYVKIDPDWTIADDAALIVAIEAEAAAGARAAGDRLGEALAALQHEHERVVRRYGLAPGVDELALHRDCRLCAAFAVLSQAEDGHQ